MENIENEELTSEEILVKLRADMEQKKLEAEKLNKEVHDLEVERRIHFREEDDIRCYMEDNIIGGAIIGGGAAFITWMVGMLSRAGGVFFRRIDYVKHYFNTHPEALKIAEETTGSTDLNYNAGFILGSDSAAEALFASCGYQDFVWNNLCASCVDAGIVFAAIVGGVFAFEKAKGLYHHWQGNKKEKKRDAKEKKAKKVNSEYLALKKQVAEKEEKEAQKNVQAAQFTAK